MKKTNRIKKISENSFVPHCKNFRSGMGHVGSSLRKRGFTQSLQEVMLTKEMDLYEIYGGTWKNQTGERKIYEKKRCFMYNFWFPFL